MKYGTAKILLCLTSLVMISGCAPGVPEPPETFQCAWNGSPRAFYCVNTKTKARLKIDALDARMKAAQCISADDYKKNEAWVKSVIELAKTRCN